MVKQKQGSKVPQRQRRGGDRGGNAPVENGGPSQTTSCARWLSACFALVIVGCLALAYVLATDIRHKPASLRLYTYEIVNEYPHDPAAFTQGLEFDKNCSSPDVGAGCVDIFWESTGMNGRSSLREVAVETGEVLRLKALPAADFGEGVAKLGGRLYQLLWQSGTVYSYNASDFERGTISMAGPLRDGWGITSDRSALIVSDGTSTLTWVDPDTLSKQRSVVVTDECASEGGACRREVAHLNELEWIGGEIWANVWLRECIARIDPRSGHVRGWIILQGITEKLTSRLLPQVDRMDVLNGIAYDSVNDRIFVTGKYWPRVLEIRVKRVHKRHSSQEAEAARQHCIISTPMAIG